MDAWTDSTIRDRYDRHVRRARLSVSAGASQHRLAFTVEEALRLASLPGEDEGRSYYFRRLRVTGLPSGGDRGVWLDKFQRALSSEAMQAVHGGDPRAGFAQAVFFRSEQEPLEILLHRLLARQPIHEWFWPMVTADPGAGRSGAIPPTIVEVVEKLRRQPASWVAVAAALYSVPEFDAVCLLNAVMKSVAQSWLQEMDRQGPFPARMAADILRPAQPAIQRALQVFGAQNPGTLWLTALAVLLDSPSELAAGSAVWRARGALQRMAFEKESKADEVEPVANAARPVAQSPEASSEGIATAPSPMPPASSDSQHTAAALNAVVPGSPLGNTQLVAAGPASTSIAETLPAPRPWYCFGLPTAAAGVFFLLNALRRIGMPQALAAGLTWVDPNFAALVLQRLARQAGVLDDDPVLLWLNSLVTNATDEGALPFDASWWPSNMQPTPGIATIDDLVRVWCVAVRRWCWRSGKISVRDIVSRAGVFSVNRTDLDVSLPLDEADIRVRRVGLDLDPGWLPWFGRVVRFHYKFRGEFHG